MEGIKFNNLMKIFLNLSEKKNIDGNSRKLRLSYAWFYKILKKMEGEDLIIIDKVGRENKVKFTPKGKKIREHLREIRLILDGSNL